MATITVNTLQNDFLQCRDATLLQLAASVRPGLGDEVRGGQLRPQPRHLLVRDDAARGGVAGRGRGAVLSVAGVDHRQLRTIPLSIILR